MSGEKDTKTPDIRLYDETLQELSKILEYTDIIRKLVNGIPLDELKSILNGASQKKKIFLYSMR
jgi:hypothetical protein